MIRRPRRSLPSTLLALVLLAAAALVALSCIQLLRDQAPLIPFAALAAFGAGLHWHSPITLLAGAVAAVLGLLLLAAALLPGRPTVLPLAGRDDHMSAGVSRRSLRRDLTSTVIGVDGVSSAAVRVRRARIVAAVRTPAADASDLTEQVRQRLDERLTDIALARRPRLRIRVSPNRST
jgi:hypothetical protein